MKFFLTAAVACFCTLSAAEKGSPDVIHWQGDNTEQTVQETGRLEVFQKESASELASAENETLTTCAERLAEPGKRYLWAPTIDRTRGAGGAKIPDAAVSADKTALFLLETVGTDPGPFDTRLVILDTHTGEIVRVRRFAKVRYVGILTLPDSDDLLLVRPPEGKNQTVDLVDPVSGKIQYSHAFLLFSDLLVMGDLLLAKQQDHPMLTMVRCRTLQPETTIKTAAKGGKMLPESTDIVNIVYPGNPAKLERIPMPGTNIRLYADAILTLPEGFSPACGMLVGKNKTIQLWMEPGGDAMLRIGKTFHRLAERVNGLAVYHAESKTLYLGLLKRDMLAEFHPEESTALVRSTLTGQLRPITRGESKLIFCSNTESPRVLIMDHRANLYQMQPPDRSRMWKKTLIFSPEQE